MNNFVFPRWTNHLLPLALTVLGILAVLVPAILVLGFDPQTTDVGYAPVQPVSFSHAQHAGTFELDCRYCHSTVDKAAFAAVPPTQTCMNCHTSIKSDAPTLQPVRDSYAKGTPINWKKVHDLPDYVYFNHAAHVNQGVGCVSCHGRVDQREVVRQEKPLSMAWCLECHRAPEKHLRPREHVTDMKWDPVQAVGKTQLQIGEQLKREYGIQGPDYMTSCSTCHR